MNQYRVTLSGALGDIEVGVEGNSRRDAKYVARVVYGSFGKVKRIEKI